MEKLHLTLDDLQVQSFVLGEDEGQRGTVRGHDQTVYEAECATGPWAFSCPDSCQETCPDTCRETCGCYEGTWWYTMC